MKSAIREYSHRLDIWKSLCDQKGHKYTTNKQIPSYLVVHLSKDFTFYGRKDSFNTPIASMVTKHKSVTYLLLRDAKIPIPTSIVIVKNDEETDILNKLKIANLSLPLVLKPSNTDNSVHVYIIKDIPSLIKKASIVFNDNTIHISEIVIQQYINIQKEYRVLVFNKNISHNKPNQSVILLAYNKLKLDQRIHTENFNEEKLKDIECGIVASKNLLNGFQLIIDEVVKCIPSLGWSGIDIIEDENGKLWFLEINSDPGFKHLKKYHGDEKISEIYSKMLDYMAS
jgi:D-alanine-D-alanine ligase-like ATP-grasp enzyme